MNIVDEIRAKLSSGDKIPKPQAVGAFRVKGWGMRRGKPALVYLIPNHRDPGRPHQKGITDNEWRAAQRRLLEAGELTREWFDIHLSECAAEGSCNFTTVGGVFVMLGYARHERGRYVFVGHDAAGT